MVELDHPRDRMGEAVDRSRIALCSKRKGQLLGKRLTELLLAQSSDICFVAVIEPP